MSLKQINGRRKMTIDIRNNEKQKLTRIFTKTCLLDKCNRKARQRLYKGKCRTEKNDYSRDDQIKSVGSMRELFVDVKKLVVEREK